MSERSDITGWVEGLRSLRGQDCRATLVTGESITGTVAQLGDDLVVLRVDEQDRWLRISSIILLAPPATAARAPTRPPEPRPRFVEKPVFAPELELELASEPEAERWHPSVAEDDLALYQRLRAAALDPERPPFSELRAALDGLVDRHPAQAALHRLRGALGWVYEQPIVARRGFFRAAALGLSRSWREYAAACLRDDALQEAQFGLEAHLLRHSDSGGEALRDLTKLADWHGATRGLGRVLRAVHARGWPDEQEAALAAIQSLDAGAPAGASLEDWAARLELREDPAPFASKVAELTARAERIQAEARFADIEEDISGLIHEAEELLLKGKLNSAFDRLNEGYLLVPAHPRVRAAEAKLRGSAARPSEGTDHSRLESTLNIVFSSHDVVIFDTSVLSVSEHLSREEAELHRALREEGKPGLASIEEKVAYHKLMERLARTWSRKVYVTEGVLDELSQGLERMTNRVARQSFGKSGEALRRALAECLRGVGLDEREEKRVRTLKATFNRLRKKGGLSEVDYDLVCRAFVLGIERDVALLSNDRGIHRGVSEIQQAHQTGNRNIAFLVPDRVRVYASIQKSHFELVDVG